MFAGQITIHRIRILHINLTQLLIISKTRAHQNLLVEPVEGNIIVLPSTEHIFA